MIDCEGLPGLLAAARNFPDFPDLNLHIIAANGLQFPAIKPECLRLHGLTITVGIRALCN